MAIPATMKRVRAANERRPAPRRTSGSAITFGSYGSGAVVGMPPCGHAAEMTPPSGGLRVVLIDDHAMVGESLSLALATRDIAVVARAETLADGLTQIGQHRPDVVLLDYRLPDGTAIDGIHSIHEQHPGLPILVLTAMVDDRTATAVIHAGASGYLTKDLSIDELVEAIVATAAGQTTVAPALVSRVIDRMRSVVIHPTAVLTGRELDALRLLDQGLGVDESCFCHGVSRNTARKHVQSVLQKIGAHTQLEAVAIARRERLIQRDLDD